MHHIYGGVLKSWDSDDYVFQHFFLPGVVIGLLSMKLIKINKYKKAAESTLSRTDSWKSHPEERDCKTM